MKRWGLAVGSVVSLLLGGGPREAVAERAAPPGAARANHLVVITGLGGEAHYRRAFRDLSRALIRAAIGLGIADSSIIWLSEDTATAQGLVDGISTRTNIELAIARLAGLTAPDDHILFVLVGHGSGQGSASRFSVPGPDISAADFARLLGPLSSRKITFVNTASASGDFIRALSGPGRVIITATKSAFERNETMFPRFFVAALDSAAADTDKDARVSILEAFEFARREVARAYEKDNRLLTEHAQLDDNGDGAGTAAPNGQSGDGALARTLVLGATSGNASGAQADPALVSLLADKARIEQRLAALRARKAVMDSATYEKDLEKLLLDLARNGQAVRSRGAKPR